MQPHFQAPATPFERHLESNQKVQLRPPRPGPPLNLLIALQMSLKGSYGSLKVVLQKVNCGSDLSSFRNTYDIRMHVACGVSVPE
jgi:hypothetical protein